MCLVVRLFLPFKHWDFEFVWNLEIGIWDLNSRPQDIVSRCDMIAPHLGLLFHIDTLFIDICGEMT